MTTPRKILAGLMPDRLLVAAIARAHRRFEPELAALEAFLPSQRRTAIDVGTWYGPWTIALAKRFDHVIGFEPNPAVASRLARALPPNAELIEAAASARAGSATLHAPTGFGAEGVGYLGAPRQAPPPGRDGPDGLEVATRTIDELGRDDVDLIKLDVEGHEFEALNGALHTIDASQPVLVVELEARLAPVEPVVDLLASRGYQAHEIQRGRLVAADPAATAAAPPAQPRGYVAEVLRPDRDRPANNFVFLPTAR